MIEDRVLLSADCTTVPALPSIVTVQGTQLLVQERLPDGSLGNTAALVAHGVNWSPSEVGTTQADLTSEFRKYYQTDIPLMEQMGVNVVRVYHDFGTDATAFQILDAFYEAGIKVIVTVDSPQGGVSADLNNVSTVVNAYKNHPAILMWNVGIEWDINGYYGTFGTIAEAAQFTETAAELIKSLDPNHPVTTAIADPNILKDYTQPANWYHPLSQAEFPYADHEYGYMQDIIAAVPSIDVWSLQIYRGGSFQDVFQQWASISTKPVLVTEFGADAYDHGISAENQAEQAKFDAGLWDELNFNLSAVRTDGIAIGGLAFEFQDEWWKNGTPDTHTVSSETNGGQPDGFNDEEWFGLLDINRQKRQAYTSLQDRYVNGETAVALDATPTIQAISQYGGSSAVFEIDGKVVFDRAGGAGGGRGINVAVLDPNTGIRMTEVRSFDTWANSTGGYGGPHVNFQSLIDYLNSLPNGAIIALSIGDEGGFIQASTGKPWQEAVVEQAYETLEGLGSQQIRNVGYDGGWAMIAVKEQGMLAEGISAPLTPVSVVGQVSLNLNPDAGKRPNLNNPVIAAIGSQTTTQSNELCVQIHATDDDLQALQFSLDDAPAGATIDKDRGTFSWTPASNQLPGTYNVTVRVTDTGSPTRSDTKSFTILVTNAILTGTTLDISGTSGNDTIAVSEGTSLIATVNGVNYVYDPSLVKVITVEGLDGADTIVLSSIASGTVVTEDGGAGDDTYVFNTNKSLGSVSVTDISGMDRLSFLQSTNNVTVNLGVTTPQVVNSNLTLRLASATSIENLYGGSGNNTLTGNSLDNVLVGGPGDDVLRGGGGNDTLVGGDGNDTYAFDTSTPVGVDTVVDSSGIDRLWFVGSANGVAVNLGSTASQAVNSNLTLRLASATSIENLYGGSGNNTLTGNSLDNVLVGGPGDDVFRGGGGNDTLVGGDGNDTYAFDTSTPIGSDTVVDSSGIDRLWFVGSTNAVAVNLSSTASQAVNSNLTLRLASATSIENLYGGSGKNTLTGNTLDNVIVGGNGDDTLSGGSGNDTLVGGDGNDTYSFNTSTPLGSDTVTDSSGVDRLWFAGSTNDVAVNLGTTASQAVNSNLTLRLASATSIENVYGGSGNNILIGNTLDNILQGGSGNNVLSGSDGNDTLIGGAGRNVLIGGNGSDSLTGGSGEDLLLGARYVNETNIASLTALLAEWKSADTFDNRTAYLLGILPGGLNGSTVLTSTTVKEDAAPDTLAGGAGRDWYLRNSQGVTVANRDTVNDADIDSLFTEIAMWL